MKSSTTDCDDTAFLSEADSLWQTYHATRDQESRDALVMQYMPLVSTIARRFAYARTAVLDYDDLVSQGTIGLMNAIERYDASRGIKFETFAFRHIEGAIIDHVRLFDTLSRNTRRQASAIQQAVQVLKESLNRTPTDEEVAAHLVVRLGKLRETVRASGTVTVSLNSVLECDDPGSPALEEQLADVQQIPSEDLVIRREVHSALQAALERLPKRQRLVIALHHQEELSFRAIAERLGFSESWATQLHQRAIEQLRASLQDYGEVQRARATVMHQLLQATEAISEFQAWRSRLPAAA